LILLSCSLLLLSAATLFKVNYLNYAAPMPYSRWKNITFYDFKGFKIPSETLFGSKEFAFISTSREADLINDSTIMATTYFHPSRSYVFDQQIRDPALLQHELYHFHIAEYCTRLLRKEIADQGRSFTRSKLNDLVEKYNAVERGMQVMYDGESYHSYVLKEQKRWESHIDSTLLQLGLYSNPLIYLKRRH